MKYTITPPFDFCLEYMYCHLSRKETGYKLPNIDELAARIGVAKTVLREVLRVLDFHGVIRMRHGKVITFISTNRPALVWQMQQRGLLAD